MLGAVVIDAAIGLVKVPVLRRVKATSRVDFAAYAAAALACSLSACWPASSSAWYSRCCCLSGRLPRRPCAGWGWDVAENVYVDADKHPAAVQTDGVVIAELAGPLFFADAAPFRESVLDMIEDKTHAVVIDLGSTNLVDMDEAEVLTRLQEELQRKNVKVVLARVADNELDILDKTGTIQAIGQENST